jgi:ribosomal protein L11 methyltransferase
LAERGRGPAAAKQPGAGEQPGAGDLPGAGKRPRADNLPGAAIQPGAWLELSVEADLEAVEAVSEILGRFAPGGTSVEPAFELVDEGLSARVDPTRPATVRAYLPARDLGAGERAVAAASEALGHLQAFGLRPIGELSTRLVHEADWAEAWKAHFPVLRVGHRLVIRPTWRRHRAAPDDIVLALDPGMAFGTGLHPTTRLCLAALERLADGGAVKGARALDVGCGSGILAIAAAKLGAAEVIGVDTDPIAIEATDANARRNRVARRVLARRGSIPSGQGAFGVVLANLIASLLVELARPLRDELIPGGVLLASGIFVDREGEVRAALVSSGLNVTGRDMDGDWVLFEARRPR